MDARKTQGRWRRFERLWLFAFVLVQLFGLWQCFGAWYFSAERGHGL